MSDSNGTPYPSLVGAPVRFVPEVQGELGIDWEEGIIACLFATNTGVGIHVTNPETGETTPGISLEGVSLQPDTVSIIRVTHKAMKHGLDQVAAMFGDD